MVHEKYIKRGGKVFGPYYYESYREGGKIKKRYIGTSVPKRDISDSRGGINLKWLFVFVLLIIVGIQFFFFLDIKRGSITGNVISSGSDLVLYLNFDSEFSGVVRDESQNGNDGNVFGADWTSFGRYEGGVVFNGLNDNIVFEDSSLSFDFPGKAGGEDLSGFTIGMWANPDVIREQTLASKESSWEVSMSSTGFLTPVVYSSGGRSTSLFGGEILLSDEWTHLVFVYDFNNDGNSIMRLYINGVLDSIRTDAVGDISKEGSDFVVGGVSGGFFDGSIDELIIFGRPLSESEVGELYDKAYDGELSSISLGDRCPSGYYNTAEGCKIYQYCNPNYVCSPLSACDNGYRDVLCEDVSCGLSSYTDNVRCQVDVCVPKYDCGGWSECVDGISIRECVDVNNCGYDFDKPVEEAVCDPVELSLSPGGICVPDIECGEWSQCEYVDDVVGIINGEVRLYGMRERECIDLNSCVKSFRESSPCESEINLTLESEVISLSPYASQEYRCDEEVVALYLEDEFPVSYINLPSWKDEKRFDVSFVQSELNYCSFCYDGVRNFGEEGIDCGGACKECDLRSEKSLKFLIVPLWILMGVLFVVLLFLNRGFVLRVMRRM